MHPDGLNRLRIAIVRRSIQDYVEALRILHKYGADPSRRYYCSTAKRTIEKCELFFMEDLDRFVDLDGKMLMEVIQERSYDPDFRIREEK